MEASGAALVDRIPRDTLARLFRVGLALGAERDGPRLMERILSEAKSLTRADGGTLYLRTDEDQLELTIILNDTLKLALGGANVLDEVLEDGGGAASPTRPAVPLFDPESGAPNHAHVAAHAVHLGQAVNIADAYQAVGLDFSGTREFDARHGYRSTSFLTVPMSNQQGRVIGALQLINARDEDGRIISFDPVCQAVVECLSAQAAVALDAFLLLEQERRFMNAFLEMLAGAIDRKSPYTGGHCRRVPELTEMIVDAMIAAKDGPMADFGLTEAERYELHIAGWLHDCGKVTTPPHVMDKATKLEGISDGIERVRLRLAARAAEGADPEQRSWLNDTMGLLERCNRGAESMSSEDLSALREVAALDYPRLEGGRGRVIEPEELERLSIQRGTLTEAERLIINGHMVDTVLMLEALPFPRNLSKVPDIAGGHHERMDGEGYPRGIFAGDLPETARAMAIADVFEALTAADRPYKKAMPLSLAMKIMGGMKVRNHLDPVLFDFFVTSGVYRRYAEKYLPEELRDEVDEAALLALEPQPFALPPSDERARRWDGFRPEYEPLARRAERDL